MNKIDNDVAKFAKTLALYAVRNTCLEDIHHGKTPISNIGDYSDVIITDANGREIKWNEASHISDEQMKKLMKEVVNKIYDVLTNMHSKEYQEKTLDYAHKSSIYWDDPDIITRSNPHY